MTNKKARLATPLHNAIRNGEKEFIEKLFQYDYVDDIETTDELGLTPLHIAVLCKNDAIAKLLIDNGANVNEVTSAGNSALIFAARYLSPLSTTDLNFLLKWLK